MIEPILDSMDMFGLAAGLPGQLAEARAAASDVDLSRIDLVRSILVLGAGTAATAGDALAAVVSEVAPVPVLVHREEGLPGHVDSETLVLSISPGGDAPDAASATRAAFDRGAPVVAFTSGGRIGEMCAQRGAPVVAVPDGVPARALFGSLVVAPLVVMGRLGLTPGHDEGIDESITLLQAAVAKLGVDAPRPTNRSYELALGLDRRFPLVVGSAGAPAVAAYRWKCQVNENAKAPASWAYHPEADHNLIAGFGQHGDVTRQLVAVVELRHRGESDAIRERFEAARPLLEECVASVHTVRSEAETPLGVLFDLVVVGDFTSLFLAALATVDPGPVDVVIGQGAGA